jgi:hypothetical protein
MFLSPKGVPVFLGLHDSVLTAGTTRRFTIGVIKHMPLGQMALLRSFFFSASTVGRVLSRLIEMWLILDDCVDLAGTIANGLAPKER